MGTHALTKVYDEQGEILVNMYTHYDGYPHGHGKDLAEFLTNASVTPRFGDKTPITPLRAANGMSCLAAQIVARFKTEPSGTYLYPASTKDVGQEWEYHIRHRDGQLIFQVYSCDYGINPRKQLEGPIEDLIRYTKPSLPDNKF